MVSFIPPYLGEEVKSNAERKVFEILRNLKLPNAIVLHSLGLPRHKSKIYGEIDFVIICSLGIACLEIKGGGVSYDNGQWIFTDRYGRENVKAEGPFDQVTGAMFSLRERIWKQFANNLKIRNVTFACGVVFPDIEFKHRGQSIIPEIIFDARHSEESITDYVKNIFAYWQGRNKRLVKPELLSKPEIENIRNFLRGDFGFIPSLSETINTIDKRLLRLTEEQYYILDSLSGNDRLLIEGAAGTGKTILAVEYARRQSMAGKRTLLIVYNKNLSAHLKRHENDLLKIEHFHGLIAKYIPVREGTKEYFEKQLPEQFYERLIAGDIAKYDTIIIDEAQDLLKTSFLLCIDELLKGGLEKGRWSLFYDRNQNIYNDEFNDSHLSLKNYNAATCELQCNCRNTKPIGLTNSLLTHFPPARLIKEDGENVEYVTFEDERAFAKSLGTLIKKFKLESFNLSEITVLSPVKYQNSLLWTSKALQNICEVAGANNTEKNAVNFSTIQGFKGLDAKVVILIDIEKIIDHNFERLLYTGISRAKVKLFIFCSPEAKHNLDQRYLAGVKKMCQ